MKKYLPILDWLPNYNKTYLSGDLSAGLTVGVMLIPQGMAYAMIAGLPPVYGLYAAIVPQIIYAFFGTSRQLAVGPVAMDSLLVAAGISTLAVAGSENYIALAILLSLMMGIIQLVFGLFKMGFLVNFLSKPVISGFTSAAALIIGLNQFKYILGFELERSNNIFLILREAFYNIQATNSIALGIAVLGIIIIKTAKKIHRAIPGALIAVIVSILLVKYLNLAESGINIIGDIPRGLPSFNLPTITSEHFVELIPVAFTLALIAFMESISVAKAIQNKHRQEYDLDNNQEMIGLGMGNIIGSMFGAYPTTGGFSRSAVNDQAGAKTNLAAVISALLVGLTLLFLTPLFYHLPKATLGAIILVAVFGLIDWKYPVFLWKSSKEDFVMLFIAFAVTLGLGVKEGIGAGVIMSLIALIYRSTKPHIAVLGKLPNAHDYRNINRFSNVEIRSDVLIMRHDAELYFANISNLIDQIKQEIENKGEDLRFFVFHCGNISHIDVTALEALKVLITELKNQQIEIAFCQVIGPVRDFLHKTGFIEELGEKHFFVDVESAIHCYDECEDLENFSSYKPAVQTNVFREKEI